MEEEKRFLIKDASGKILAYMQYDTAWSEVHDFGVYLRALAIAKMTEAHKSDCEATENMIENQPKTECEDN